MPHPLPELRQGLLSFALNFMHTMRSRPGDAERTDEDHDAHCAERAPLAAAALTLAYDVERGAAPEGAGTILGSLRDEHLWLDELYGEVRPTPPAAPRRHRT
jgi:hypothetical protein